jgi:hypothetical protein
MGYSLLVSLWGSSLTLSYSQGTPEPDAMGLPQLQMGQISSRLYPEQISDWHSISFFLIFHGSVGHQNGVDTLIIGDTYYGIVDQSRALED